VVLVMTNPDAASESRPGGTNQVKSLQLERKVITAEVDSLADKARSNSAILANRSIVGGTPFDFFY
jgi:hypothetical protein